MTNLKNPLLEVRRLTKSFARGNSAFNALENISFSIFSSQTLGLIGESGCGKSTLAKIIVGLEKQDRGEIFFEGNPLNFQNISIRKKIQIVLQNPYASLNPLMTVCDILSEPFLIHKICAKNQIFAKLIKLLDYVGFSISYLKKYPHELSGGQRQRIAIARAISLQPKLLVLDEAVSALDVSVQAQILNLLVTLQNEFDLSYLFITHDLGVVKYMSDKIAVMQKGKIVEFKSKNELFQNPEHPYTKILMSSKLGFIKQSEAPASAVETLHLL